MDEADVNGDKGDVVLNPTTTTANGKALLGEPSSISQHDLDEEDEIL